MRYQFCIDGRGVGPLRTTWRGAAQDAVNNGIAQWVDDSEGVLWDATGQGSVEQVGAHPQMVPPPSPPESSKVDKTAILGGMFGKACGTILNCLSWGVGIGLAIRVCKWIAP